MLKKSLKGNDVNDHGNLLNVVSIFLKISESDNSQRRINEVYIYVNNVQQCMCALQRKCVMVHIGPNLIILYLNFKEYIDKTYALCNS